MVEQSILGGVTMVQLREKDLAHDAFLEEARRIGQICRRHGVPFLIDDDVELAAAVGADGVHVGQHDMEAGMARAKVGPDMLLGVSAQTVEQALRARPRARTIWAWAPCSPRGRKPMPKRSAMTR